MNVKQQHIMAQYHGALPSTRKAPTFRELRLRRLARRFAGYTRVAA